MERGAEPPNFELADSDWDEMLLGMTSWLRRNKVGKRFISELDDMRDIMTHLKENRAEYVKLTKAQDPRRIEKGKVGRTGIQAVDTQYRMSIVALNAMLEDFLLQLCITKVRTVLGIRYNTEEEVLFGAASTVFGERRWQRQILKYLLEDDEDANEEDPETEKVLRKEAIDALSTGSNEPNDSVPDSLKSAARKVRTLTLEANYTPLSAHRRVHVPIPTKTKVNEDGTTATVSPSPSPSPSPFPSSPGPQSPTSSSSSTSNSKLPAPQVMKEVHGNRKDTRYAMKLLAGDDLKKHNISMLMFPCVQYHLFEFLYEETTSRFQPNIISVFSCFAAFTSHKDDDVEMKWEAELVAAKDGKERRTAIHHLKEAEKRNFFERIMMVEEDFSQLFQDLKPTVGVPIPRSEKMLHLNVKLREVEFLLDFFYMIRCMLGHGDASDTVRRNTTIVLDHVFKKKEDEKEEEDGEGAGEEEGGKDVSLQGLKIEEDNNNNKKEKKKKLKKKSKGFKIENGNLLLPLPSGSSPLFARITAKATQATSDVVDFALNSYTAIIFTLAYYSHYFPADGDISSVGREN